MSKNSIIRNKFEHGFVMYGAAVQRAGLWSLDYENLFNANGLVTWLKHLQKACQKRV